MVLDQPERPLGDRAPERLDGGGDVVGRVDRLADVVEQGGEQEFLVVRPRPRGPARRPGGCGRGRPPRGGTSGSASPPPAGPAAAGRWRTGRGGRPSRRARPRAPARRPSVGRLVARAGAGEGEHLVADLGVGGEVAGPDPVPEHGRRLPLGRVELRLGRLAEPARRVARLRARSRSNIRLRRLDGDLVPDPVAGLRGLVSLLELVVHEL